MSDRTLVELAERYRGDVPEEFLAQTDALASDLVSGRAIERRTRKGRAKAAKATTDEIGAAILAEIRLFLCTDDPKYSALRAEGGALGPDAVRFIAGVVVGALGGTAGLATGCVAFVALAVAKVGINVFCRLTSGSAD